MSGSGIFYCPHCSKNYTTKSNLSIHIRTHTRVDLISCEVCLKKFNCSAALNRHSVVHNKTSKFKCSICYKAFGTAQGALKHEVVHTGEKPFKCNICHKAFNDSSNLSMHIRAVHDKIRNHTCLMCNYSSTTKAGLLSHLTSHTNERSFQCDICENTFKCKKHLTAHKIGVHNTTEHVKCSLCSKSLPKFRLKRHVPESHGNIELKVKCGFCDKKFRSKQHLEFHLPFHSFYL